MEETKQRSQEEKRKEFEHRIMTGENRWNCSLWIEFAKWERRNNNLERARRVFARGLARLPSWFKLWYQYIRMELMLGNVDGARQLYQKAASEHGLSLGADLWISYAQFEDRNGNEIDRAHRVRAVFEQCIQCYKGAPRAQAWIWYANFEEDFGGVSGARNVYERGIESYEKIIDHDHIAKSKAREEVKALLVAFAEFEVRCNEIDRARCVYKRAIDYWPLSNFLYFKIVSFKNQYGNEDIDDLIERKRCYEQGRIED
uniref:protein crooked neck-like n=1 Tax=Fragaria vesca subsp. vesca TaxID=101020 RepID=UPI0005C843CF|nr:PREDICTED: protein crooked neck-like [Fragaria vesca subsp. vesca]